MQKKLTAIRTPVSQGDRGSILLSVVALSMVMSLAAIGFMQLSGSISRNESTVLEEARALYAVESGLSLGAYAARMMSEAQYTGATNVTPFSDITINGYRVRVVLQSVFATNKLQITANTIDPVKATPYRKTARMTAACQFNQYAQLYGREHPENNPGGWWLGWWNTNNFVGRFHMNDRIRFHTNQWNWFNFSGGLVTVSRGPYDAAMAGTAKANMNYTTNAGNPQTPNINGYINNFDRGVEFWDYTNVDAHAKLNQIFKDRFLADQPAVNIDRNTWRNVAGVDAAGNPSPGVEDLPVSSAPPSYTLGPLDANYRPTLTFRGNGQVVYNYYDGGFQSRTYSADGRVFFSRTDISVHGVVSGKTAVVTNYGKNIVVVDDGRNSYRGNNYPGLVYPGFSVVNGLPTVPASSTDVIGLISGNDIYFAHSYIKKTATRDEVVNIPSITNNFNQYLYVCGALNASAKANEATGEFSCVRTLSRDYRIFAFGSSTFAAYKSHLANGNQYYYDSRLAASVAYPNQTFVKTNTNPPLLILNYFNWTERDSL